MNIEKEIVRMKKVLDNAEGVTKEDYKKWVIILGAITSICSKINLVEEHLSNLNYLTKKKVTDKISEPSMNESVYKAFKDIGGK